jgi:putative ABC transport system substrate-binding protein
MKRRWFIIALAGATLARPRFAAAQQPIRSVGVLLGNLPLPQLAAAPFWQAFVEGLHEHGWDEGRNIALQPRAAEGNQERYQQLAAELVASRPDIIVTAGSQATQTTRQQTNAIPIVMVGPGDPIGAGFIASLARPGGNITGLTNQLGDLAGKTLQLMKDLQPRLSRIAVLWNPDDPGSKLGAQSLTTTAPELGLTLVSVPIKVREDLDAALVALERNPPEALLVHPTPILFRNRGLIVTFALQQRLPSFTGSAPMVRDGMLASYAPDSVTLWRRAADYVDRILRGANPADMPVEQPTKFELVINLKTAGAIGLDVPRPLLLLADEVIE